MENDIIVRLHKDFEKSVYKQQGTDMEFWLARDLQNLLGYARWENFAKVIEKAKTACLNSGQNISDHFVDVNKMVKLGSGSRRTSLVNSRPIFYFVIRNSTLVLSGLW
jgi:DNA-damage-inducible protein D